MEDKVQADDLFRYHGFNSSYIPAAQANVFTHGGECVAARSRINSRPVPDMILKQIQQHFNNTLRFAARIVRFQNLESVSLIHTYGSQKVFSERNQTIFKQIAMLSRILGLPFLALGDFNITW